MPTNTLDCLQQVSQKSSLSVLESRETQFAKTSLDYLVSPEALASIKIDPYWPKWDSPWWHMMLLHEMGLTESIPSEAINWMLDFMEQHYLKSFPFKEEDVPAGLDPLSNIACHCQLGTMHQLLKCYGVEEARLAWLREWYLRYKLPDGGLNCDEAAYLKPKPKSSVVSTLPPLEAMLAYGDELSKEELSFLDDGARYLIERKLFRSATTGAIMDEAWLKLCFPRFYHYDILRGLSFLLKWSRLREQFLPATAIVEAVRLIDDAFPDGLVSPGRQCFAGASSRFYNPETGSWSRQPARSFPLLEEVSREGSVSPYLTEVWQEARVNLASLLEAGLISDSES